MSIAALPQWAEQIAEAFRAAGPDVAEKRISGRRAYVVADRMLGDVELRADGPRAHLRLGEPQRASLRHRSHVDPNALDTLVVVTESDRDFVIEMVPYAYKHARSPQPAAQARQTPPALRSSPGKRRTVR